MIYLLIILMSILPPSGKQLASIVESDARLNLWHGSVRSGKTVASVIRWLDYVRQAPPGDLLMTGKTQTTLKRNVLLPMSELMGCDYTEGLSTKQISILGRRVYVEGANDERSMGKIQGMTLAGHYGDEITLWPESYWKMSLSRISVEGAKFFGTMNPEGPYHYIKQDYIDRQDELDIKTFHLTISDNPHLSPAYVESLKKEYTGLWRRRYIDGLWVKAEGAIYDMFEDNPGQSGSHTVSKDNVDYSNIIRYWVGVDYGTVNPTVFLLLGQHKDGTIYVLKEYRWDSKRQGRQKTDSQYASDFKRWIGKINYSNVYIDPSAVSFALELRNQGVKRVHKADNTVLDGIRNVSTLLSNGLLKIVKEECPGLIKEMSGYVWDEKAAERGEDKPMKVDDHGPDALRYPVRMIFPGYCKPYVRAAA